jgi:exopolyphosphatase/guanosine-5'-triphosphate,3'-diphosphate pyrophosphatase
MMKSASHLVALVLQLEQSHEALFAQQTEKDMKLLAGWLGLGWRLDVVPQIVR